MYFLAPKHRRDPNAKVQSLYYGVASGNRVATRIVKPDVAGNHMESTSTYEPGLPRGQGGQIGILILGGMETTLDEMEYILEEAKRRRFVPQRTGGEVSQMCHALLERRNDLIRRYHKSPSSVPGKRTVTLHLPVGYRYAPTSEPGLQVLARV